MRPKQPTVKEINELITTTFKAGEASGRMFALRDQRNQAIKEILLVILLNPLFYLTIMIFIIATRLIPNAP